MSKNNPLDEFWTRLGNHEKVKQCRKTAEKTKRDFNRQRKNQDKLNEQKQKKNEGALDESIEEYARIMLNLTKHRD